MQIEIWTYDLIIFKLFKLSIILNYYLLSSIFKS